MLQDRKIFNEVVWQFAFKHNDYETILDYLRNEKGQTILRSIKGQIEYIETEKLKVDSLNMFEYHPLLSNRVHNFMNSTKSKILNVQFQKTYKSFLQYIAQVPAPQPHHYILWTYYLLLQERIDEAIEMFKSINKKQLLLSF